MDGYQYDVPGSMVIDRMHGAHLRDPLKIYAIDVYTLLAYSTYGLY